MKLKLTKVTNDQNENSIFEVVGDVLFEKNNILGMLSESFQVRDLLFHQFSDQFKEGWHVPPLGPIYVIFMSGKQEIEVTSGVKKVFGVGDMVLFEDIKGIGHKTQVLEGGMSIILSV